MPELRNPFEMKKPRLPICAEVVKEESPFDYVEPRGTPANNKTERRHEFDIGEDEQVIIIRYKTEKTIGKESDVTVLRPKGKDAQDEVALCMAAAKVMCGDTTKGVLSTEKVFTDLMDVMMKKLLSITSAALLLKFFGKEEGKE